MRRLLQGAALALALAGCAESPGDAGGEAAFVIPPAVTDPAYVAARDNFIGGWRGRLLDAADNEPELRLRISFIDHQGAAQGRWQGSPVDLQMEDDTIVLTSPAGERVVLWQIAANRLEGTYLGRGLSVTRGLVLVRR